MACRGLDFKRKDVINIENGACYGRADDVEIDTGSARLLSLVVLGRFRFLGLLGRDDDIVIPWEDIQVIGEDTILVKYTEKPRPKKKKFHFFEKFFD